MSAEKKSRRVRANRLCGYITVDTMAECVDGVVEAGLYSALWDALNQAKAPAQDYDDWRVQEQGIYEDWDTKMNRVSVRALWGCFDDEQRTEINKLMKAHEKEQRAAQLSYSRLSARSRSRNQ
tara:strand:+ start:332 stop:700 length:369 start_codon:yes stop_codon:yes gene_type:complete